MDEPNTWEQKAREWLARHGATACPAPLVEALAEEFADGALIRDHYAALRSYTRRLVNDMVARDVYATLRDHIGDPGNHRGFALEGNDIRFQRGDMHVRCSVEVEYRGVHPGWNPSRHDDE